jgi:hypothetical protein
MAEIISAFVSPAFHVMRTLTAHRETSSNTACEMTAINQGSVMA